MPVTREQFDKLIGEGFTVEEIVEFDKRSQQPTQPQQQPQQPVNKGEQRLQQRGSAIADLIQNPPETDKGGYTHPLGTLLRYMQGAGEYAQGIPSSVGLDLQQGQPQNIVPNLGKVLTGQRPAQTGDIYAGAGLPEPLAAGMGLFTDVMLTPGGARGTVAAGKAGINVTTKGMSALKDIFKATTNVDKAQRAKQGLDAVRTTLGKAKEIAMQEIKDLPVDFDWSKAPEKVIKAIQKPEYGIQFAEDGKVINTVSNLDKVKVALQDIPTTKDFVEAGNMAKRQVMQFAGKVRDAIVDTANAAGKPELAKSLSDYHKFMDNYNLINDHLVDKYGNAMANKLKATFKWGAEPVVKNAWKEVAKQSPELKSVMKGMETKELLNKLLSLQIPKRIATGSWQK